MLVIALRLFRGHCWWWVRVQPALISAACKPSLTSPNLPNAPRAKVKASPKHLTAENWMQYYKASQTCGTPSKKIPSPPQWERDAGVVLAAEYVQTWCEGVTPILEDDPAPGGFVSDYSPSSKSERVEEDKRCAASLV